MVNFYSMPPSLIKSYNHTADKGTLDSRRDASVISVSLLSAFTCVVCIIGLVGNGTVIRLLGFRMKRTPFTIYILNLAVADFGVLISTIPMVVLTIVGITHHVQEHCLNSTNLSFSWPLHSFVSGYISFFFYSTSQFLLTAISIDRCMSVLFPLWYRCRRPKKLSTVLSALIWLLIVLVHLICFSVQFTLKYNLLPLFLGILLNAVVCLPLTTVSTLILFVRFCFKSQQRQREKLIMAILLTLFFFLTFAFPLNIIYLIKLSPSLKDNLNVTCYNLPEYGLLCATLNSFVNPLLYFLVGRKKKGLFRENLKLILRRVFVEEEEACREEPGTQ